MDEATRFRCAVDVWALTVRHAMDTLLSLGRPYEVKIALPAPEAKERIVEIADLGFDLTSVEDASLLLQVAELTDSVLIKPQTVHSEAQDPELRIGAIAEGDFLVGMNLVDFRVMPISLERFRKELHSEQEQTPAGATREVTLHFMRLDRLVMVNPSLKRTHDSVLETLANVDRMRRLLVAQHDELLTQKCTFVVEKLSSETKLLEHIHALSQEIRATIMENQPYQLAQLRRLFDEMNDSHLDDEVEDKGMKQQEEDQAIHAQEIAPQTAIEMPVDLKAQTCEQKISPDQPRRSSRIIARQKLSDSPQDLQPEATAAEHHRQILDHEWIDLIPPDQIEWLPNAEMTLRTFQQDLADCFMVDDEDNPSISQVCRKLTEQILHVFKHKQESKTVDNSAMHEEFTHHVRLLLEKLKTLDNKPLRSDLVMDALSMTEIWELSNNELAPENSQMERQGHSEEQHGQSYNTIEPTKSILVAAAASTDIKDSVTEAKVKFDTTQAVLLGDHMMRSADAATWNEAGVTAMMVKSWPTSLWILLLDTLLLHQAKDNSEKQIAHLVDRLLPTHLDAIGAFCHRHLTATNNADLRFRWLTLSLRAQDLRMLGKTIAFLQEPDCTKFMHPLFLDLSKAVGSELTASILASNTVLRKAVTQLSEHQIDTTLENPAMMLNSSEVDQAKDTDVISTDDVPAINDSIEDNANEVEPSAAELKEKKRVTFAGTLTSVREIESRRDPPMPFGFYKYKNEPDIPTPTQNVPPTTHPNRPVSTEEGVTFVRALFNPNYYLIGLANELCEHLRTEPMFTLGQEFVLAPGAVIYRQSLSRGCSDFKAQFQLAHLFCESKSQSKHDANVKASEKLVAMVTSFRRKFTDILQKLKCNFEFGVTDTRQARDRAFNFLVENKIVKIDASYLVKSYEAIVSFDSLPLAMSAHENEAIARHEGKENLMRFLMEMVRHVENEAEAQNTEPPVAPSGVDLAGNSLPRTISPNFHDSFDIGANKEKEIMNGNCDEFSPSRKRYHSSFYHGDLSEPTHARRKIDRFELASPASRQVSTTDEMTVCSPARTIDLSFSVMKQAGSARIKKPHAPVTEVVAAVMQECEPKNSQDRGGGGLSYNESSESTGTDYARFRATMRSLFTIGDNLCADIKSLRESLKYTGAAEKRIVANVKATIKVERLREGIFEVRVAVNDVLFFVASERTKYDACTAAIDGVIGKLNEIRCVWAQLLHFFHMKSLSTANDVEAFHSLRLTNIAKIITAVEKPPSLREVKWSPNHSVDNDVHCAIRINDNAVFRVSGKTESDVRSIADWKTAAFLKSLIDGGLDPEPIPEGNAKIHFEIGRDVAVDVVPPVDWSCVIRTQDVADAESFQEFRVEGSWCIRNNILSEKAFPLKDIVLSQRSRIPIAAVETFLSNLHPSVLFFFSLDSAYEQREFVKAVAAFGDKRRAKADALVFDVSPASGFVMYLLPPGATINSANNLYWPANRLPRELSDRKKVYGFLKPRNA